MSAQLISMRSFRKSQIALSAHETDPDCAVSIAAARALLAKHLHRMGEDAMSWTLTITVLPTRCSSKGVAPSPRIIGQLTR